MGNPLLNGGEKLKRKEIEFAGCKLLLEKHEDEPLVRVYQEVIDDAEDGTEHVVWMEITE